MAEGRQVVHAYDALPACDNVHDDTLLGPLIGATLFDEPIVATVHSSTRSTTKTVRRHSPEIGTLRPLHRRT